jgi:thiamine-phosphate pyrophosphorylase
VSTHNNPPRGPNSPLLCYVTDRQALRIANPADSLAALIQKIEEVVAAGIDWVQIREKDLPARELASLTRRTVAIAAKYSATRSAPVRVLVNDRLDVAIAEQAGGVHLGETSLPVAEAKRLVESALRKQAIDQSFMIGASCHSIEAAKSAERDGVDYIFFGPIFPTPSKAAFGAAQGVTRLAEVCRAVAVPVVAIGGIDIDNANLCLQAGGASLAAIRLFQDAPDAVFTVGQLHQLSMDSRRQSLGDPPAS